MKKRFLFILSFCAMKNNHSSELLKESIVGGVASSISTSLLIGASCLYESQLKSYFHYHPRERSQRVVSSTKKDLVFLVLPSSFITGAIGTFLEKVTEKEGAGILLPTLSFIYFSEIYFPNKYSINNIDSTGKISINY